MPKGKNQKFKLYRLAQIMLENTDEEHYITMPEIKEKLEQQRIDLENRQLDAETAIKVQKLDMEANGELGK